jgi:hypothetical protein
MVEEQQFVLLDLAPEGQTDPPGNRPTTVLFGRLRLRPVYRIFSP